MSGITTLMCGHSFSSASLKEGIGCWTCRQLKIYDWKTSRTVEGKNLRGYQIKGDRVTFRMKLGSRGQEDQVLPGV